MIAEAIAQLSEYSPEPAEMTDPLLCSVCDRELLPAMELVVQTRRIGEEEGETIFYLSNDAVCIDCYEGDPVEAAYIKADYYG